MQDLEADAFPCKRSSMRGRIGAYLFAWLRWRLHTSWHGTSVRIHYIDTPAYLLCGCGRVFWPPDRTNLEQTLIDSINRL